MIDVNRNRNNCVYSSTILISGLYFLLCFLILPENLARKSAVVFVFPVILIIHRIWIKRVSAKESLYVCLIVIAAIVAVLPAFFSEYNPRFSINLWVYLLLSLILFGMDIRNDESFRIDNKWRLILCWCSLAVLIYYSFIHTDYSQGDLAFGAYNGDKNYAAFIVFLFFMLYMKLEFWPGAIYPIAFLLFCNRSRGLILCLLLFWGIKLVKIAFKRIVRTRKLYTFGFIVFSTIAIILFSYLFMYSSVFSVMGGYRESLVDDSNKMRFNANLYAVDLIRDNSLVWSGYGDDLNVIMGVDDGMGDNSVNIQYNGFRLVQSHNSVINIVTRAGIIPSLIYLFVLGFIADRHKTYDNLEYYYSFLIYGLILPYYFGPWVIAWFCIMHIRPISRKQHKHIPLLKSYC